MTYHISRKTPQTGLASAPFRRRCLPGRNPLAYGRYKREEVTHPLTNPSHVLTTSSIVGRLLGFADQHFSINFHISVVRPSCSAVGGLTGRFPSRIRTTTAPFVISGNGTLPEKTSKASIANAKTSAGLDAAFCSGPMISGANHRGEPATPGVAAVAKTGFEVIGVRP